MKVHGAAIQYAFQIRYYHLADPRSEEMEQTQYANEYGSALLLHYCFINI
jgi:hypothetical protein